MRFKDTKDPSPHARTRELRRLWLVKVFDGDHTDPDCPIVEHKVIAWNAVDANNQFTEELVCEPEALGFVTWPRVGDSKEEIFLIENTRGPTDVKAVPSVDIRDEDDEGWLDGG